MSLYQGAKISTRGLVFAYDMPQPLTGSYPPYVRNKSWKGQPTTNIVPSAKTMASWGSYSAGNDGTFITEFSTTGYKIRNRNTWNGIYKSITLPSAGTYTLSAWFRIWGKTSGNNGINVYTSGGGIGDTSAGGDDSRIGEWQRISMTRTYTTTGITFYIISWGGTSGVDSSSWDVTMPQIEAGSVATPFVDGTRSNTQALLDWTGNYSINASNLTFNNDGTFKLNSSNPDYVDLGSDQVIKTTGGWTVESWVKFDTVPGSYDNVNSPGNFIGSDSVTYNSWYWSVLYNKLALWNISPGTWRYGSTTLQANTWYQTVLVSDPSGTSYQMYLNGIAEGGDHTTYSWNASYSGLRVRYMGRGNSGNTRRINGYLPITKIYNRALTAEEVYRNFQALRGRYGI